MAIFLMKITLFRGVFYILSAFSIENLEKRLAIYVAIRSKHQGITVHAQSRGCMGFPHRALTWAVGRLVALKVLVSQAEQWNYLSYVRCILEYNTIVVSLRILRASALGRAASRVAQGGRSMARDDLLGGRELRRVVFTTPVCRIALQ